MTISLETDHRSMTGTTPGDDGGNGKARWAAMLAASRDEYAAATRLGRGGIETVERYSERMDDMVRAIAAAARQQTSMPVALCAIGGYGRRALCLHSDIDLLLLFERPLTGAEESYVKAVVQPLWDLRLTVGQHVRRARRFRRGRRRQPRVPPRGARRPLSRPATSASSSTSWNGWAGARSPPPPSIPCWSSSTSGTNVSTTPTTSSSPTSSRRRAAFATSWRRAICGRCSREGRARTARPGRMPCARPRTFSCASVRCCTCSRAATSIS